MRTANEVIAEAASFVAAIIYFNKEGEETIAEKWINRQPRYKRIRAYRDYHNIPDSVPDDVIAKAIIEDWDVNA